MRKKIAALAMMGVMAAGTAYGSGYRVPEQSINAVALSNAYIANAHGPDSAYYNPANMGWQEDRWQIEVSASYINLPHINYSHDGDSSKDGSSKTENIFIPMFHAVSPDYQGFRFGFSFVVPYGLSKRWNDPYPKTFSEEFTLKTFEGNPTISYKLDERFSLAAGLRIMHSSGNKVKSDGILPVDLSAYGMGVRYTTFQRDLDGSDTNFGYNLAASFKPTPKMTISATYRSQIDLDINGGDVTLYTSIPGYGADTYTGNGEVTVVTPAVLTVATSYTFDRTTVELTWDKTFWSDYETLDFNYSSALSSDALLNAVMTGFFDDPVIKNWKDSNAYRIGLTHKCTDQFTAMLGFAYDETPIPSSTLNFELPGSDGFIYSLGCKYKMNDNLELGGSYLYDYKKVRDINTPSNTKVEGKFQDAGAHVLTLGMVYKF